MDEQDRAALLGRFAADVHALEDKRAEQAPPLTAGQNAAIVVILLAAITGFAFLTHYVHLFGVLLVVAAIALVAWIWQAVAKHV